MKEISFNKVIYNESSFSFYNHIGFELHVFNSEYVKISYTDANTNYNGINVLDEDAKTIIRMITNLVNYQSNKKELIALDGTMCDIVIFKDNKEVLSYNTNDYTSYYFKKMRSIRKYIYQVIQKYVVEGRFVSTGKGTTFIKLFNTIIKFSFTMQSFIAKDNYSTEIVIKDGVIYKMEYNNIESGVLRLDFPLSVNKIKNILESILELQIDKWNKEYKSDELETDGYEWIVEIEEVSGKKIKRKGYNKEPDNFKDLLKIIEKIRKFIIKNDFPVY